MQAETAQEIRKMTSSSASALCIVLPADSGVFYLRIPEVVPGADSVSEWTSTDRRIAMWSATGAATIGVIFVVVGLVGVGARPPSSDPLRQVDPYLAVLEVLMMLFAVVLVVTMAAVCTYAPLERKTFALAALAFVVVFAVLTCGVHFANLTVGRQIPAGASPLLSHELSFEEWPSLAMSLDLLAWDFFLGVSLLCAATVFTGEASRRVRLSMILAGALCLAGTLGPASGRLSIQYLGIAGYAFALPVACALLAMHFRRGVV
jgi:hypothetical protein